MGTAMLVSCSRHMMISVYSVINTVGEHGIVGVCEREQVLAW